MLIDLTANTVVHYKMNDNEPTTTIVDSEGFSNAVYSGDTTENRSVEGKINKSLNITGSTDYIEAGTSSAFLSTFQNSFSINSWFKFRDGRPSSAEYLFGVFNSGPNDFTSIFIDNTKIYSFYRTAGSAGGINVNNNVFIDEETPWHMVTYTVEQIDASNVEVKTYIDGQLLPIVSTGASVMSNWTTSDSIFVGSLSFNSTPFLTGKLDVDDFRLMNKVLIQDEISFLYNNGFGTELSIGSSSIDEFNSPTLTYPVGGEKLTHETIQIEWDEPVLLAQGGYKLIYWYEIFYSIDTISEDNRVWHKIADVPSGNSIFNWKVPHKIRSDNCRIGIRLVDNEGGRTPIIMSPDVFSIQNKILPSPAIFSPLSGDKFFTYIPVIFDQGGLAGQFPKRAHYRVAYSSNSQEIDWVCIKDNIPISTSETFLDVSEFSSAKDYSLKFELIDGENSSQPVFIDNITINNLNFFKIDTVPPTGKITIRNNPEYIKDRDVILELISYDVTSGTESFRVIQKEIDSEDPDTEGPLFPMAAMSSWRIVNNDGVKIIQASFVDFAGNALEPTASEFFFRTYKSVNNREITSLLANRNGDAYDIWQAVGGVAPELYLNGSSVVGAEVVGTSNYLPTNISGTGTASEQRYNVEGLSDIDVVFNVLSGQNGLVIEGGGSVLKDTGLTSEDVSFNLSVGGIDEITIKVTSESAGDNWRYGIDSKNEYPLTSDFYNTSASKDRPVGQILSMSIYNEVLYLGEETKEAKGLLQRHTGGHIESIFEITTLDSSINSMVVFDGKLFLACANGELYSFNGTTVQLERTFESGLHRIGTDGNLLYIFLNNSIDIYTAYKDSLGELNYVKTTLE